jgi:Flp pilus assembly protein TadD
MSHGVSQGGRPPLGIDRSLRAKLDRLGEEFLADFLGREVERHPYNAGALADLAHVLTRLGRLEDGLAIDRRLVRLEPENPTVQYNLACSLALLQRADEALDALERAVELGYDDAEHLLADEDLAALRGEERFVGLARQLEHERELL